MEGSLSDQNEVTVTKTIVRGLAVSFCIAVTAIAGCTANTNYQKRILAQTGADPIAINCLYGGSYVDCLSAVIAQVK